SCPEYYPEADLLHVGELGDATDRIIEYLDTHRGRPRRPLRFETATRLPLSDFPVPAYHLTPIRRYFLANIQFSSGCPYSCEFCDIPALYGKNSHEYGRSEEHTSELQSRFDIVCRLLLEKKNKDKFESA